MANSEVTTVASGSTDIVSVPFLYLSQADVHVSLDEEEVSQDLLTFATPSTIQLPSTPASGVVIRVWRVTPNTAPLVTFQGTASLAARDLNTIIKQVFYICQEALDRSVSADEVAASIESIADEVAAVYNETVAAVAGLDAAVAAGEASEDASEAWAELAEAWAEEDEDVPVASGQFSAKHWAAKALQSITQNPFGTFSFTGDGATTAFDLETLLDIDGRVLWFEDGIYQQPGVHYTTSGTVLTRGTAPLDGALIFGVVLGDLNVIDAVAEAALSVASATEAAEAAEDAAVVAEAQATAAAASAASAWETGDLKEYYGTGARAGWVRLNGRTLGNAESSATERANADTEALFLHLWAIDDQLTVSGGRTDAASDYAANKTITLPDFKNRATFGVGSMGGSASGRIDAAYTSNGADAVGSTGGADDVVLTDDQMPIHKHDEGDLEALSAGGHAHNIPMRSNAGTSGGSVDNARLAGSRDNGGTNTFTQMAVNGAHPHDIEGETGEAGGDEAHPNMPPFILVTKYIKL